MWRQPAHAPSGPGSRATAGGDGAAGGGGANDGGDGGADASALDGVLSQLIAALGAVAAMLSPFTPEKAAEIWRTLGGDGSPPDFGHLEASVAGLKTVRPGGVLFPRP